MQHCYHCTPQEESYSCSSCSHRRTHAPALTMQRSSEGLLLSLCIPSQGDSCSSLLLLLSPCSTVITIHLTRTPAPPSCSHYAALLYTAPPPALLLLSLCSAAVLRLKFAITKMFSTPSILVFDPSRLTNPHLKKAKSVKIAFFPPSYPQRITLNCGRHPSMQLLTVNACKLLLHIAQGT